MTEIPEHLAGLHIERDVVKRPDGAGPPETDRKVFGQFLETDRVARHDIVRTALLGRGTRGRALKLQRDGGLEVLWL